MPDETTAKKNEEVPAFVIPPHVEAELSTPIKKGTRRIFSDETRKFIPEFIKAWNRVHGKGGTTEVFNRWGIATSLVSNWQRLANGVPLPTKSTKVKKTMKEKVGAKGSNQLLTDLQTAADMTASIELLREQEKDLVKRRKALLLRIAQS